MAGLSDAGATPRVAPPDESLIRGVLIPQFSILKKGATL